jgi:hypothetical protein
MDEIDMNDMDPRLAKAMIVFGLKFAEYTKEMDTQYLSSFSYINNSIGPKSIEKLEILMPNLIEINYTHMNIKNNDSDLLEKLL